MALMQPDRYFSRVSAIDPRFDITLPGYETVLLDVDNTLLTRDEHLVPTDVSAWLAKLKQADIPVCLLSNNWHASVLHLADELDLPIVAKALKPLPMGFLAACRRMGTAPRATLMIGDQLSTDVLGAHLMGMGAYLVCPLVEEDLLHTRLARVLERALIADREPEGAPALTAAVEREGGAPERPALR